MIQKHVIIYIPKFLIHSTFDEKLKTCNKRKKTKKPILCRMYLVNPKDRQRYFIRLLLLHVKGATSFENLRTVMGAFHSKT